MQINTCTIKCMHTSPCTTMYQCMYTSIYSIIRTHVCTISSTSYLLYDFLAGCNLENEEQLLICVAC